MPDSNDQSNDQLFAQSQPFWDTYLKGRPRVPDSFFERIFAYHAQHSGSDSNSNSNSDSNNDCRLFGTVHDVGAGNGPYAARLRQHFEHVIVSDVVKENVDLAKSRLGTEPEPEPESAGSAPGEDHGFSYRVAKVEDAADIPPGSVDMVFATNVLHFADQAAAMAAVAHQLRPGGTFACAGFGPVRFDDEDVQDVWNRISQQGGRVLLERAQDVQDTIRAMERSMYEYNVAPVGEGGLFRPGARRLLLNMERGGLTGLLPPERRGEAGEPVYRGERDVVVRETDEGWRCKMDLDGFREHVGSFPYERQDPKAFEALWKEMEDLVLNRGRSLDGCWPAAIILATRK